MGATTKDATPWARIALIYLCGVMSALNVGKMPPALPALQTDFTLSLIEAGVAVSAFNIIGALLGFAAGALADRLGAKRMITTGLIATALGNFIGAGAGGAGLFVAGRILEGVGYAVIITAAPTLLAAEAAARDRNPVLGAWGAFMPVGVAASLAAAPFLLEAVGWRGFWNLLGLAAMIVFVAFVLSVPAPPRNIAPARGLDALRRVLGARAIVFIGAGFGAYSFAYLSLLAFIPVWLMEARGVSLSFAAMIAAAFAAVSIPGNVISAWLLQRGAPARSLALVGAAGIAICPFLTFPAGLPIWVSVAALLAFSAFSGFIPSSVFALVPSHAPSPMLVGSSNGLVIQFLNIGSWLGPPVVAAAVSASGWSAAPVALSLAALTSAAFFFAVSS
ncbi:MAG: CynX/NimT family MFS transporter [Parvularculaceae bacterium]